MKAGMRKGTELRKEAGLAEGIRLRGRTRKRRFENVLMILLCGGMILMLWIFLLPYVLERFREDAFGSTIMISGEEIYPFGVEYANLKKRLLKANDVLNHSTDYSAVVVSGAELMQEEYEDVRRGCALLEQFVRDVGIAEGMPFSLPEEPRLSIHLFKEADEGILALLYGNEDTANWHVFFEPGSGIPIAGTVIWREDFLGEEEWEVMWENLAQTFGRAMGIPFQTVAQETRDKIVDYIDEDGNIAALYEERGEEGTGLIFVRGLETDGQQAGDSDTYVLFTGRSQDGAFVLYVRFERDPYGKEILRFQILPSENP